VYSAVLVDRRVAEGKRLVTALDDAGLNIRAAFWYFNPEREHWKLVLSFPMVDQERHLRAIERVRDVLFALDPPIRSFKLPDILVQTSESRLVKAIGDHYRTAPSALEDLEVDPFRSGDLQLGGAYIYRAAA